MLFILLLISLRAKQCASVLKITQNASFHWSVHLVDVSMIDSGLPNPVSPSGFTFLCILRHFFFAPVSQPNIL